MSDILDLGHDHTWEFTIWKPDRALNPQYAELPDETPCGGIIDHVRQDGTPCRGAVTFDTPTMHQVFPDSHYWRLIMLEPLTLEPSILCHCGDHGFIRQGIWVPA